MFFSKKNNIADSTIIEDIQKGGFIRQKSENQLFTKYHYFIKESIKKHKISEDDALSAYSDTIISVINNIVNKKFEGRSELKTYIFQIFSNKCVDIIRKNSTKRVKSIESTYSFTDVSYFIPDNSPNTLQELITENDISQVKSALQKIGEKCKKMLLLWGDDYNDDEIATQLNYNSAAVARTSRLRCIEKLKELF